MIPSTGFVLLALSTAGAASHLVPHEMGFSTVGAVAMLAAAYLPRHLLLVPVLATVAVADAVGGGYGLVAMGFVYLGHLAAAAAVAPGLSRVAGRTVAAAAVVNALVFYLISNVTPMALSFYPPTLEGWLLCYWNGVPFLLRGIAANLVFGGLAFAAIHALVRLHAHRFAAAQRH